MKRPLLLNIFSKLYRHVSIFTWCEWREATFPVLLAGTGEQWTSADLIGLLNLRTKKWHLKTVNSVERRNRMWNKIKYYIFFLFIFFALQIYLLSFWRYTIFLWTWLTEDTKTVEKALHLNHVETNIMKWCVNIKELNEK